MTIFLNFVTSFLMMFTIIYCWHKMLNKEFKFTNYKIYVSTIILAVISMFNFFYVNNFIRISIITFILMLFYKFLFQENMQKVILTPVFTQFITMISELIFTIVMILIVGENLDPILRSDVGIFFTNIVVTIIIFIIHNLKIVKKLYNILLNLTNKIRSTQLVLFCLIVIIFLNIFIMSAYYKIKFEYWLAINIVLILVSFIIVVYSFKTKNKYNIVYDKYNIAITSLKEYENIMTKYRVTNHENKNLLLTIRAMILNKEKDIPKYIDSIIEEKYTDDEKLLFKMSVIPSGGLRATIYSKILKIKNKKINYLLDIDKKVSTIDLIELDENTIIDICKIIGVFIDNAIDEVLKLRTKNIQIHLYVEKNNLYIKITNNYKSVINVDKIYEKGYTTKDKGHGYGLTLVKETVERNKHLENNIEISKDLFSQILTIKYK